jgi:hypothetical protein
VMTVGVSSPTSVAMRCAVWIISACSCRRRMTRRVRESSGIGGWPPCRFIVSRGRVRCW